ncbi:hypothetical protein LGL08_20475 [Clostridium estertheticum]|uniref:hypothetical protein n=1 Tax=Clostridium estertheticum TaxID=238834 RepID=UPI001CF46959|nr:hypothetical protein [Clostridium estertheticum]MCB2308841.1 hypothetical protein [Clostridium estertheticum]MCB2347329.1 hypothetical protein [Clostridium estertheticum]MCB2351905.1 hypothetical protein [Clostridium estertheticum]WAG48527.1 hypothetical protein LL127_23325 [Clostridium estertheticum]
MRTIVNKINSILLECSSKISMHKKYNKNGCDYNEEIETNEIIIKALRLLLKTENDDSHVMHGKLPF